MTYSPSDLIAAADRLESHYEGHIATGPMLRQGAAWGEEVARMRVPDRYGRRKVSRMLAEWNALRSALASGDREATQEAFDACEEWIDFAYGRAALAGETP